MQPEKQFCYAARCRCGCGSIVAATLDDPNLAVDTAEFVHDLIKDGYAVERISVDDCQMRPCKRKLKSA